MQPVTEQITNMSKFLKELYMLTKDRPTSVNVQRLANVHNTVYSNVIATILAIKGIIEKKQYKEWIWISTTEPNVHMAEALIAECKTYTTKKQRKLREEQKNTLEHSDYHMKGTIKELNEKQLNFPWKFTAIMASQNRPDNYVFNIKKENEYILIW